LLAANSRHNVRYLSGGYYYHFHENSDRMGRSRYLPFLGIVRNRPDQAFYVRRPDEAGQLAAEAPWMPRMVDAERGTLTSAASLVNSIRDLGLKHARIGLELPFLPADAYSLLRSELPDADLVDATAVLDGLREIKSKKELAIVRGAYSRLAEAIHATFERSRPGMSTKEIELIARREIAGRDLSFLFALVCAGPGTLRAPSTEIWEPGRILHIDAGGSDLDYVADICRMGCAGKPSPLARDLHAACLEVQDLVRSRIKPGLACGELLELGRAASRRYKFSEFARFVVHGIGMVPYEQPLFSESSPQPLEAGMVLSIETDFIHPLAGHVKIEDAVAVTASGCEGLGDLGRDWTII
ncbi:MAG: aminopeptidase P family protein, partial [Spirochaetales bacterium]